MFRPMIDDTAIIFDFIVIVYRFHRIIYIFFNRFN